MKLKVSKFLTLSKRKMIKLNKENFTSSETSQQNLTDENEENKSNTDEAPNNMENEGSQEKIEESDAEKMSMMIDENETLNVDSIEDTSITNEKATSTEEEGNSILRINRDISETTNEHNLEILFEKESEENEGSGNSDLLEENAQVSIQTVIESDEKGESTEDKQNEEFSTDENLNTNAEFSTDEFEKTNNIEEHNSSVQNDLPQENTNNDISIENNGKDDEIYKSKEVEQDVSEDPTAFNEDINIVEEEDSNGEKNVEPDKTDFETKEKPYEAQNNTIDSNSIKISKLSQN
uniref:CSON002373 protein n=1 Tax=Culicoides sonorensis TaxID=179676 RepID=A0A336LVP5_CULSO